MIQHEADSSPSAAYLAPAADYPCTLPVQKNGTTLFNLILNGYKPTSNRVPVGRKSAAPAVLLIHGASANSLSFWVPMGRGLAAYLRDLGWEVWTLDWRGSRDVIKELPPNDFVDGSFANECNLFCLDEVAKTDFPMAIARINSDRANRHLEPVHAVVAHCFGSGALAMSISRGHLEGYGIENVVFSTLGLFYEVAWNGWVKVEDFLIERIMGKEASNSRSVQARRAIDASETPEIQGAPADQTTKTGWPADMLAAYGVWPPAWLPSGDTQPDRIFSFMFPQSDRIFKGLSFMFGRPYERTRVPAPPELQLKDLFGGMHLGLYLHAGQLVRRGFADTLNGRDVFDRSALRLDRPEAKARAGRGDLNPEHFRDKRITLITGSENQLWHRDSIDLMYEWLRNQRCNFAPIKRVRAGYAHQDLLWSTEVSRDSGGWHASPVYEWIAEGASRAS